MSTTEATTRTRGSSTEAPDDIISGAHQSDRGHIWRLVTLLSTLVGLTLRLGIVATRDLWADEAFTWRVTSAEFDRMLARLQTDIHPPLHYLLMWVLQEGVPEGWGPTYLRLANLVWFVALGALAAWSSRRPELRVAVVPGFCVVAVAPGFVQAGSELRMYGLLLLLVALLLVAVTTIVDRPSPSAIVVATLAATAAAWTHYAGVVAATAIITAGLVRGGWKRFKPLAPVAVVFAFGVLALIPFALPQLGKGISYKIGLTRMARMFLDDLSVLGLALLVVAIIFAFCSGGIRRAPVPKSRSTQIAVIGVISVALFSLGMLEGIFFSRQTPSTRGLLDDLIVLGLALLVVAIIFAFWTGGIRRASVPQSRPTEIAAIALISVALFSLGILAWYVVKGQNPVNEGVSTVAVYLLLVGILGLRIVPSRTVVAVVLLAGVVTAGCSVARLWGAPNYSHGKRVSHVDVLDEAIRQYPPLAANGGSGWLIVHVDWSDMNHYFRGEASERLPLATVAVGTPANGVVKAKIDSSRGAYQRILVIRRPDTGVVGEISGYELRILDSWTAIYSAKR
jgi:hypothetical protein